MKFNSLEELLTFVNKLKILGYGSQGKTFYDINSNKVFKIYYDALDGELADCTKTSYEVLRFKDCLNKTYVFAFDAILLNDIAVGYIEKKAPGKIINQINPLNINLDKFISSVSKVDEDVVKISKYKIKTHDVVYNIMYGNGKISIIDFDEYVYTNKDYDSLLALNRKNFNMGIKLFLVDTYFDEFVASNKYLNELYKDKNIDINLFLSMFKKYICEYMDYDITKLNEAKKVLNKKKHKENFVREYKI